MKLKDIQTYIIGNFDSVDGIPDYEKIEKWLCENCLTIFNTSMAESGCESTTEMIQDGVIADCLIYSTHGEKHRIFQRAAYVFETI